MTTATAPAMQRARRPEHKEARAKEIRAAGLKLCRARGYAGFTMADLAAEVGLAKGTLFLYFPTKEALGIALIQELLGGWFEEMDQWLGRTRAPLTPLGISRAVGQSLDGRDDLVALLGLMGSLFEHNVDATCAAQFKLWLLQRLSLTGALLEKQAPWLPQDAGMRFLIQLHALVVGLHAHARPSPVVAQVLEAPELAPLKLDFAKEVTLAARTLLEGVKAMVSNS